MIVNEKYKLGALVRSGEVATFEAQEIATGLAYYVHLLSASDTPTAASLTAEVRARLAAAQEGADSPLIEQGDYDGSPFVVTRAEPELVDLRRWIEGQPAPQEPGAQSSGSTDAGGEPGEFTRMFRAESETAGQKASQEKPAAPSSPPAAPAGATGEPRPAAGEPGEFTKMFAAGGSESPKAAPESAAPPTREPAPVKPESPPHNTGLDKKPAPAAPESASEGEFTKMFRQGSGSCDPAAPLVKPTLPEESPASTAGADAAVPKPPAIGTDEPGIAGRETRVPADPGLPPASSQESAGEFTRMFQQGSSEPKEDAPQSQSSVSEAQSEDSQPPAEPPQAAPPSESAAQRPPAASPVSREPLPAAPIPEPPKAPPQQQSGQTGEFTTLFRLRPEEDAPKPGPKPSQGDSGISDSGLRRLSPEERREEMRQFRMVSREGGRPGPPESRPAAQPQPPAQESVPPPRPPSFDPPPGPPAAPPAPKGPGGGQAPGEFTRLFQGGGAPPPAPTQPPAATPPPPGAMQDRQSATELTGPGSAQSPSPPPQQEAGEFTRLFQSGSAPRQGSQAPPPSAPPREWPPQQPSPGGPGHGGGSPAQANQTGEFTKLFREAKPAGRTPEPTPLAPPPAQPSAGEFTRLFGSGMSAVPPGPERSQPPPPPPGSSAPGDFTRMFGGGGPGSRGGDPFASPSGGGQDPFASPGGGFDPGRPSEPPEQQGGEFTRLFGTRPGQKPGGTARWGDAGLGSESATQISRKPEPPPAEPPPAQGPSEFTRLMGSGPGLPRQQAPMGQQAPPQAQPKPPAPPQQAPPPQQPPAYAPPAYAPPPQAPPGYAQPGYGQPGYAQPPAPPAPQPQAPPPVAAQPPPAQPAGGQRERDGSDRSMYLIFALIFCALLLVALGVVLFVSMTSDSGQPPAQPVEGQQGSAQVPTTRVPSGLSSSVRAPSVSSPSVQAPSATAPSISSSGVTAGSVRAPSVTAPSVSSPSVSTPSVSSSSVSTPRLPSGQVPATSSAQTAAPAAESSGTPFLALIIILSVLLVIAVGTAVYFAVRRS